MPSEEPLLRQSVNALTQYFVGDATMGETLRRVSELAAEALPQAALVGITMMLEGRVGTFVFTDPDVVEIDQAQYRTGRGPCINAFETGETFTIDSTVDEHRWQEFCAVAREHQVLSTLSMPMIVNKPIGAMNLYARSERAFTSDDVETARQFAMQAAFVLANAQAYWDSRTLSENLEIAMASRSVIEQAKGVIIGTNGVTADEAFQILVDRSQRENVKLRDIAQQIVQAAAVPKSPA